MSISISSKNKINDAFINFVGEPKKHLYGYPLPPLGTYTSSNFKKFEYNMETLLLLEMEEKKETLSNDSIFFLSSKNRFQSVLQKENELLSQDIKLLYDKYLFDIENNFVSNKSLLDELQLLWIKREKNIFFLDSLSKILQNSSK